MVRAIPTMLFLVFLYYYFKFMLFGPLEKVLKQREELTAGARKSAEASLAEAERKQQGVRSQIQPGAGGSLSRAGRNAAQMA